jgi:hypothetical protein
MSNKTHKQQAILEELRYEVWMFNGTADFLVNTNSIDKVQTNAFVESFLMHTRNLVDFLEDRTDDGDARCSDFGIKGQQVKLPVGNTKREINKYLAHITKQRIKKQSPDWKFDEIKNEINQKIRSFLDMLPNDLKAYRYQKFSENLFNTFITTAF